MTSHQRYQQNPKIPAREVGGEITVITPQSSHIHRFNGVGAWLWCVCKGEGATLEELVVCVLERYEVSEERAREDVRRFVDEALQKNLLLEG